MSSSNKKPLIGILTNIETIDKEPFIGQEKASLQQNYINSIIKAGGVPILLPVIQDVSCIQSAVKLVDGLMLTGGQDVKPQLYGEEPHPDLGSVNSERDRFEIEALLIAYEMKKPILGICRGLQIINVAFGGTLYQDLRQKTNQIKHSQQAKIYDTCHSVEIIHQTLLHSIFQKDLIEVNSFHHQSVKKLASGFKVNAVAKDGIIEGAEKADYPFLVGVQWHPERMVDHHNYMLKLFSSFIEKAAL